MANLNNTMTEENEDQFAQHLIRGLKGLGSKGISLVQAFTSLSQEAQDMVLTELSIAGVEMDLGKEEAQRYRKELRTSERGTKWFKYFSKEKA